MLETEAESGENDPTQAAAIMVATKIPAAEGSLTPSPPPEILLRNAVPEPQTQVDCVQASQQAQQSASQQIQQATQSASRSVADVQNSASQAVAAALRTASQAAVSASLASASAKSAVASALSRVSAAESRQSLAQSQASSALLQAGVAVAAATGSATAAGSSFLAASALATAGGKASISGLAAQASSQVQLEGAQAQASRLQGFTAIQVAIVLVASIILSALMTILIYFLISSRRKAKKGRRKVSRERAESDGRSQRELDPPSLRDYPKDIRSTLSNQDNCTIIGGLNGDSRQWSDKSSTYFGPTASNEPRIKETSVRWNPRRPPKAPKLSSWLKEREAHTPIASIKLSVDKQDKRPLGGQLRSPLRTSEQPATVFRLAQEKTKPPTEVAKTMQVVSTQKIVQVVQCSTPKETLASPQDDVFVRPEFPALAKVDTTAARQGDSRKTLWTDDTRNSVSPPTAPLDSVSVSQDSASAMRIPAPVCLERNTAEWVAATAMSVSMSSHQDQSQDSKSSLTVGWRPQNRNASGKATRASLPSSIKLRDSASEWGTVGKAY